MVGSRHALQVFMRRRDAAQQLPVDLLVDLELGMGLDEVPYGGIGAVALPSAVGEHLGGHVFDHGVEHHAVAAHRGKRSVGLRLPRTWPWVSSLSRHTNT